MLMFERDDHIVPHLSQMDLEGCDISQDDMKYMTGNLAKPIRTNSDNFTKQISQLLESDPPSFDNSTPSDVYLELLEESKTPPAFSQPQSLRAPDSFRLLEVDDLITSPIVPANTAAPIVPASLPNFTINSSNTRRTSTRNRPSSVSTSKSPKSPKSNSKRNSPNNSPVLSPSPACPSSPNHTVGKRTLPPQHKPARGRGRKHQLKHMTEEQIEEEAHDRAEKNRLAAKECRVRRKNREATLRDQVLRLQKIEAESQKKIKQLLAKVKLLEARGQ